MATASDKEMAVARVYGDALLELARQQDVTDALGEELRDLRTLLDESPGLHDYLVSPTVDESARAATLEKALRGRASDLLVNALQVMNRKGRLGIMRSLVSAYELALEDFKGRVLVEVRTAVPLSDELRTQLQSAVSGYAGRQADLVERVDPEIAGGLVVRVGDQKLDMSVRTRLRLLAQKLADRASVEIHSKRSYVEAPPRLD